MPGKRARALWLLMAFVLLAGAATLMAQPSRELISGETRTGSLSADQVAQVYTVSGDAGDQISLLALADNGAELTIFLTNAAGEMVAQGAGTAMEGFGLPAAGRYYVTVLAAGGLPETGVLDFSLSFAQEAAPMAEIAGQSEADVPFAPGEILVISGLQFQLQWESLANLDLEVRDPVGGSVYFSRPVTESGGLFGVNVNSICETRSSALPTEQANWSAGSIPTLAATRFWCTTSNLVTARRAAQLTSALTCAWMTSAQRRWWAALPLARPGSAA